MTGTGARLNGGRWNNAGTPALYVGLSAEICVLEKLVHTEYDLVPDDLVLMSIELPDDPALFQDITGSLPNGWDALPSSAAAAKAGDEFLRAGRHLGLIVPSIIVREARNIILNPTHSALVGKNFDLVREFQFDPRLRPSNTNS